MAGWLTVLVDNRDYVPISKLKESESGELNLTTMMPDQDRATVELYLRGGRYLEHLHTFELSDLHSKPERPRIVVSAHVRDTLNVTLRVDGELVQTESFSVPEEVHEVNWAPWLWASLLVLLLAGLTVAGVLYLPDALNRSAPLTPSTPAEGTPAESTPTDSQPAENEGPPEPPEEPTVADEGNAAESARPETADNRGPVGPVAVEAELPSDLIERALFFEPESAALLPEAREQVDAIATAIANAAPEQLRVRVEGHTALFGTQSARLELSERRAQNVANALAERLERSGVSGIELISVGLGGAEPVTREEADQWRNRRVVFSIEEP